VIEDIKEENEGIHINGGDVIQMVWFWKGRKGLKE